MGSLIRLAVIAVLAFLAYRYVRGLLKPRDELPRQVKQEKLVACQVCRLRLPEGEATRRGEHYYCERHVPRDG